MAKSTLDQSRRHRVNQHENPLVPQRFQHLASIAVLYVGLILFFHQIVFQGKTFLSSDSIASHSFDTILNDASVQGIFPLWNPYIFCGMPGYASLTFSGERSFDVMTFVWGKVRLVFGYLFVNHEFGVIALYYLIFAVGVYFFAVSKLKNRIIALITAFGTTYSMYIIILLSIGHVTKVAVLAWFPLVFLLVEKLRERFNVLSALALVIALRLMLEPGHVQFIFYIYLALGVYYIFFLVRGLVKKESVKDVLQSGATFALATIIALLMGADQYLSTREYNPYSIRGSNPVVQASDAPGSKTVSGGLDYDYATSWSFSPGEMMTFILPSWYGFGWHTYDGVLSQNRPLRLNTYWGPQPFTDAPWYMGIVVLAFAVIGFAKNRREPFVQYLGIVIGISLLLSFGKEFPLFYDLMYKYFPLFNKFRAPSLILFLANVLVPLLAGYGFKSLLVDSENTLTQAAEKRWKRLFAVLGVLMLVAVIGKDFLQGIYSSFFPPKDISTILARSYGTQQAVLDELYRFVFSSVVTDFIMATILLAVAFGSVYFYRKGRIQFTTAAAGVLVAVVVDLWRVDFKPLEPKDRQERQLTFTAPDYVEYLRRDSSQFRILELINGQLQYNNLLAYWRIQNAYGYQGAKMRIYQDMVDVTRLANPLVWGLMNVKYILSNREETHPALELVYSGRELKVYLNRSYVPRAFFVNRYEVANGLSILTKIADSTFDPREVGFFQIDPHVAIEPPLSSATAKIVRYGIQDLEIEATATGNNLLFLSEAYYPKGWKAFIDGKEAEIFCLNYLFRGVVIPEGTHKLEMRFEPGSFSLGKNLSLASNVIVVGLVAFAGFRHFRKFQSLP